MIKKVKNKKKSNDAFQFKKILYSLIYLLLTLKGLRIFIFLTIRYIIT
jgi:hypothetical protein